MKTYTTLLLSIFLFSIHAQQWTSYTDHKEVLDIEKEGNILWVATNGGLLKWDLLNETYLKFSTNEGLISNFIYDISIDAEGNKWMATSRGVSVLNVDGSITNYTTNDGLYTNIVTSVVIDNQNNKWFSCFDIISAVSKLDNAGNWSHIEESVDKKITNMMIDENQNLLLGGKLGFKYSSDGIWSSLYEASEGIYNLYGMAVAANQEIWASSFTALYHFDLAGNFVSYNTDDGLEGYPRKLFFDDSGILWIQTTTGISKKNVDNSFTNYPLTERTNSIVVSDEIVYIGSSNDILTFDGDDWGSYNTSVELHNNYVKAIEITENGDVYFGTSTGLAKRSPDNNWSYFGQEEGLVCQSINSLLATSWGELVITHGPACLGTSFFDEVDQTISTIETDTFGFILSAAEDSEANLWMGYYSHPNMDWLGTTKIDPDGNKTPYKFIDVLPSTLNNKTTGITMHPNGDMYFSTRDGLFRIDTNGELHLFDLGRATSIFVDSKENVWIGEGDYFALYLHSLEKYTASGEHIEFFDEDINKHYIYNFAEDSQNNIWMASENGLFKINPDDEITRYTTADGIADNHVTDISIDSNGELWISTLNGISTTANISTSIENIEKEENALIIYPNPSSGVFQFELNEELYSEANITVFNGIGQLVYNKKQDAVSTLNTINLEHLVRGIYIVLVETDNAIYQEKIIIQK